MMAHAQMHAQERGTQHIEQGSQCERQKRKKKKEGEKKMMKKEEEKCKHKKSYNRNGIQTFSRPRHSSHIAFKETQPRQEGNYS